MTVIDIMSGAMEPLVNEDMGEPFKSAWLADLSNAALAAINSAGFAIVPREPTEAMLEAMNRADRGMLPWAAQCRAAITTGEVSK